MSTSILRPVAFAIVAGGLTSLSACGLPAATASPEREAEARALLEDLVADRDAALADKMSSLVDLAEVQAQLPFMKTLVPEGAVPPGKVEGWRANAGTGGSTYEMLQTYDYPDRVLRVSTVFRKEGGVWKVLSFHIGPTMKGGARQEKIEVVEPVPTASAEASAP
ncbi:hypothetical protein ACO2Q1_13380 [Brevundimonas sp. VNH65]|uniref:hypothetical protein n=1 Tax=Brevundimonas sp. VNH65 TaxID=3400917 RepID=UPI003C0C89D4